MAIDARFAGDVVAYGFRTELGRGREVFVSRGPVTRSVGEGVLRGLDSLGDWTFLGLGGQAPCAVQLGEDLAPTDRPVAAGVAEDGSMVWRTGIPGVWVTATPREAHVVRRDGAALRAIAAIELACDGEAFCLRSVVALRERTFLVSRNEVIELRIAGDAVADRRYPLRTEAP